MKATALCHGAATIITGFATGNGGAYGIGLENRTTVELNDSGKTESIVNGEADVGVVLAEAAVKRALERFKADFTGAKVVTESEIPVAAGLKSSSIAANVISLAAIGAVAKDRGEIKEVKLSKTLKEQKIIIGGEVVEDMDVINAGIDAAFDAKVTATGALDDASAAYLGGYTITRNLDREIVYHGGMEETLKVLIYLPEGRSYSGDIKPEMVNAFSKEVGLVWEQARSGRVYEAITLNGLIHSTVFGYGCEPAVKALEAGAIACGLSGTGPSVVALSRDNGKAVKDAWESLEGEIFETSINNEKARVIG
ncbi:MAG: shikimate kinase [Candidatus Altiarchaeales archaeon]|nr:shikimate kinase [Candidatus Altiarchaeales archaeon]MBD3416219.1 shikimate kinase [Candidatus Altiarchaeales archaeon]